MTRPDFLPPRPELPDGMAPPEAPRPPEGPPPADPRRIPLWAPFAVMGIVFIVVGTFYAAIVGIAASLDGSIDTKHPPESLTLAVTVVQDAFLLLAAVLTLKVALGRVRPADLGLRRVADWRRAALAATALYALYWLISGLLSQLFGPQPDQQIVEDLKTEDSLGILLGFAVLTCVVAPICEEIFFRGFVFMTFARRLGPRWGALIAGGIFGLIHAPNPVLGLIALAVLGVCLCALYWRTQSIIPCMALHALNNSISFGYTKSLDAGLYVLLVVGSVVLVVALATAVSSRPPVTA
jgi:membrane protease YdiL (CAAX protease family)